MMGYKLFFPKGCSLYVVNFIVSVILLLAITSSLVSLSAKLQNAMYQCKISRVNMLVPESIHNLIDVSEGSAKVNKRLFKDYIDYYIKLQEIDPSRAETYGILGFCYYELGMKHKAIQSFLNAIKLNPNFFWYYYNLGIIYLKDRRYSEAASMFSKASSTTPAVSLMFIRSPKTLHRSILLADRGFADNVEKRLGQGMCDVYMLEVAVYYALRDYQRVVSLAQKYVRSQVCLDKGYFLCYLGMALYDLGRYKESASFLRKAINMYPKYAEGYVYYSRLAERFGNSNAALTLLMRARGLYDENCSLKNRTDSIGLHLF